MTTTVPSVKLNNGLEIPAIGLGTWQSPSDQVVEASMLDTVTSIVHTNYLIQVYGNEAAVGKGVKRSGIPRSEIWITSKVWATYLNRVEESLDETLANLGTDYLDRNHKLFPTLPDGVRDVVRDWPLSRTWAELESLLEKGKVRSIGASNCSQLKLEKILRDAKIIPAVNRLELHAYNPRKKLLKFMESNGIKGQAYSALGSTKSPLLKDGVVVATAEKKGVEPSTILLAYLLAKGLVILPKSVTPSRISDNITKPLSVKLDTEEVEQLDTMAENGKQTRFIKPSWPIVLGFEDWI